MNWGPYELDSLIHEGGGGLVIKGRISTQVCAIKIVLGEIPFSDQKLERLNQAASLSQHLIKYDQVTSLPSALVIQSRFYEGVSLTTLLRNGDLSSQARITIAQQLADALIVLHQSGIAHGDLRPENVLLTRLGRVVLMDVDQAVELTAPDTERVRARVGLNAMTPEHVGRLGLSQKSDIFAFGSFCIELFTGLSPLVYNGELDYAQLDDPVLPDIAQFRWLPESQAPGLIEVLRDCWSVDPGARPESLEPLQALLTASLDDSAESHIELATAVSQLFEDPPTVSAGFVLPQFEDAQVLGGKSGVPRFAMPWIGGLAASALTLILLQALFFPVSDPLHPVIRWHLNERSVEPYIETIRKSLEQDWRQLLEEFGRDASSHQLIWANKTIAVKKMPSGRRVLFECGREMCILRVVPVAGDLAHVWHEPIPIGASKNRWKVALHRAIVQGY